MSLADEVAALQAVQQVRCPVALAEKALEPADAVDLSRLVADRDIPATLITRVLRARGLHAGTDGVRRHRLRQCRCFG